MGLLGNLIFLGLFLGLGSNLYAEQPSLELFSGVLEDFCALPLSGGEPELTPEAYAAILREHSKEKEAQEYEVIARIGCENIQSPVGEENVLAARVREYRNEVIMFQDRLEGAETDPGELTQVLSWSSEWAGTEIELKITEDNEFASDEAGTALLREKYVVALARVRKVGIDLGKKALTGIKKERFDEAWAILDYVSFQIPSVSTADEILNNYHRVDQALRIFDKIR